MCGMSLAILTNIELTNSHTSNIDLAWSRLCGSMLPYAVPLLNAAPRFRQLRGSYVRGASVIIDANSALQTCEPLPSR